jgi:hypothetical protein
MSVGLGGQERVPPETHRGAGQVQSVKLMMRLR